MHHEPASSGYELFYFAGRCLSLDAAPELCEPVYNALSSRKISCQALIRFCDRQMVLPSVYRKLKRHGLTELFPAELRDHLEDVYLLNRERNLAILRQVNDLNAILAGGGIHPVYLKGTAHLLDGLYEDAGERLIGDIDFLVEEGSYLEAAGLLMRSGYKNPLQVYWEVSALKHFYPLHHDDMPSTVDIHRTPVEVRHSCDLSADMIFVRMKEIRGLENCFVPCDEHKIIHNFIHDQLSDRGWRFRTVSLRSAYDLHLLSGRVKPETLLSQIRRPEKAGAYFSYCAGAMGSGSRLNGTESGTARRYRALCDLSLKHPGISTFHRKCYLFTALIFGTYLRSVFRAVYRRESRRYLLSRLTAPGWCRTHLSELKRKFLG